jgi:4-amino-4-deoxy-L-arabinose transferase-like glycosyltransferase
LLVAVVIAVMAPIGPLAANRFHHDEAVYSSWALDIASGRDIMVSGSPVDKPPLFLYLQALSFVVFGATETAARLPALVATVASVFLVYRLGERLFGRGTGLLAAFLCAASPFGILFAATAFTDPLMVTFVLAAALGAVEGRWSWAGIGLGLAFMTKQQGLLFLPLVVGLGWAVSLSMSRHREAVGARWFSHPSVRFLIGLAVIVGMTVAWDVARGRHPGFLQQSTLSYGPLAPQLEQAWQRMTGFLDLLRYATGSPLLNGVAVIGLPALATVGALDLSVTPAHMAVPAHRRAAAADIVMLSFGAIFLVVHALFAFQVWDRYLLGLMPLSALLLARILTLPWRAGSRLARFAPVWLRSAWAGRLGVAALVVLVLATVPGPLQDAAASRLPVGGDHGAYDGIEQVAAYFKTVPADTTLYHRWLAAHWRFYLWGSPYDFRAWTSPDDLAEQAASRPGTRRYIVFPSWHSATEARLALESRDMTLRETFRTLRRDGSVSFIVYSISEASPESTSTSPHTTRREDVR